MSSEINTEDELLSEKTHLLGDSQHKPGDLINSCCDTSGIQVNRHCETIGKNTHSNPATHTVSHRCGNDSPTTGRKLAVLLSCWFLHVLASGCGYGMGVIFVELVREFESPRTQTALVQSIFTAFMTGGGVIFTPPVLKYGFGISLTLGTLAAALGFIVAAWANDLTVVIIFVGLISGLGTSLFYLCGFVAISSVFGASSGAPLAFITIGDSTGQFVCPYLFEILITNFGWRGTYFVIGAIVLNGFLPTIILQGSQKFNRNKPSVKENLDRNRKSASVFDITLFKDPMIMIFLCNCFVLDLTGFFESMFTADVMVLKGYERGDGSFMLVLLGIGSTMGKMTAVGLKLVLKIPTVTHWLYVCLMVAGCHAVVVSMSEYWPLLFASLAYGFSFGMIYAQAAVIMLEISGLDRYPRAIGLLNFSLGVADVLCGILGGLVNDLTGSYNLYLFIAIGVAVYVSTVSVILAYFVHKSKANLSRADHDEKTLLISKLMNGYKRQSQVSIKI